MFEDLQDILMFRDRCCKKKTQNVEKKGNVLARRNQELIIPLACAVLVDSPSPNALFLEGFSVRGRYMVGQRVVETFRFGI